MLTPVPRATRLRVVRLQDHNEWVISDFVELPLIPPSGGLKFRNIEPPYLKRSHVTEMAKLRDGETRQIGYLR